MAAVKIKWSSLLNLTELEFVPEPPKVLEVSDELVQAISWLTAATGHDRRLLRCTETGALLVGDAWALLTAVETKECTSDPENDNEFIPTKIHKGILIATSTQPVRMDIYDATPTIIETFYLPPNWLYWYPHSVYGITATLFPAGVGTASYIGFTAFN